MSITLNLNLEKVLQDPHNRFEFLAWAMSEQAFLDSFIDLIATGASPEGSWPHSLDELRSKLYATLGDKPLAEAHERIVKLQGDLEEERRKVWRLEHRHTQIQHLFPKYRTDFEGTAIHDHKERFLCRTCELLDLVGPTPKAEPATENPHPTPP